MRQKTAKKNPTFGKVKGRKQPPHNGAQGNILAGNMEGGAVAAIQYIWNRFRPPKEKKTNTDGAIVLAVGQKKCKTFARHLTKQEQRKNTFFISQRSFLISLFGCFKKSFWGSALPLFCFIFIFLPRNLLKTTQEVQVYSLLKPLEGYPILSYLPRKYRSTPC